MTLALFYQDKAQVKEVHEYITKFLTEEAVRRVFDKRDVSAVAEAKELLDLAFENLETLYGQKESKKIINEAR